MIKNTNLYKELVRRESEYIENVDKVYQYASNLLPKINRVFANYTGHGIEHSISVMEYMGELITNISEISDLELACLVYAAMLHDIGMVVTEEEIKKIKTDELKYNGKKYSVIFQKYKDENISLQECIRPVHGERAFSHIINMKPEYFIIPGYTNCNFQEEIAKICQAHMMNQSWIICNLSKEQVKENDVLNAQYLAMLLRIADYLDIDEKRAPIELYRLIKPIGFGDREWMQHYIIENRVKIVREGVHKEGKVVLYGKCENSNIHRKILEYLSNVSSELLWCKSYSQNNYCERYWIRVSPNIDNKIMTKGFEISDLKLQLDYRAIMKLLMGQNLYGDKKYGLRELIQNSLDACRVMMEEAKAIDKYAYDAYQPKIQIILDYKKEKFIVLDNGTGMTYDILMKYFLNIGKSYYKSEEFVYQGKEYSPIGTFGIGFLSCFMLSNMVAVETKHYSERDGFTIELDSDSQFVCKKNEMNYIRESGTAIILELQQVLA